MKMSVKTISLDCITKLLTMTYNSKHTNAQYIRYSLALEGWSIYRKHSPVVRSQCSHLQAWFYRAGMLQPCYALMSV